MRVVKNLITIIPVWGGAVSCPLYGHLQPGWQQQILHGWVYGVPYNGRGIDPDFANLCTSPPPKVRLSRRIPCFILFLAIRLNSYSFLFKNCNTMQIGPVFPQACGYCFSPFKTKIFYFLFLCPFATLTHTLL